MKSEEKVTKDKKTVWENNEKSCSVDNQNLATANFSDSSINLNNVCLNNALLVTEKKG